MSCCSHQNPATCTLCHTRYVLGYDGEQHTHRAVCDRGWSDRDTTTTTTTQQHKPFNFTTQGWQSKCGANHDLLQLLLYYVPLMILLSAATRLSSFESRHKHMWTKRAPCQLVSTQARVRSSRSSCPSFPLLCSGMLRSAVGVRAGWLAGAKREGGRWIHFILCMREGGLLFGSSSCNCPPLSTDRSTETGPEQRQSRGGRQRETEGREAYNSPARGPPVTGKAWEDRHR